MPRDDDVRDVPLSEIDLSDTRFQIRLEPRPGELRRSLERDGQLVPVMLQAAGGRHRVIDGHRRCRALRDLGGASVRAVVKQCSDDEALRLAFVTNHARKTLAPVDRWNGIRLLDKRGFTNPEIATALALAPDTVRRLRALFPRMPQVDRAIQQGWLRPSHLRALRDLVRRERWPRWLGRIRDERLSAAKLYRVVSASERRSEPPYLTRGPGGTRIFRGFEFDPKTAIENEVWRAVTQYERGLDALRAWLRRQ